MSDYERIALALMALGIVVGVTGVAVLVALARALAAPAPEPEPEPEPEPVKPGPGSVGIQRPTSRVITGVNGLHRVKIEGYAFESVEFRCRVDVEAVDVTFTDCLFSGPDVAPANSALLRTISGKGSATAVDCTFSPRVPQPTLDAVRGSNLTLTRCEITGTVDGIHVYGNLSDPADPLAGNVHATLCWIHDLATFPSTSHADGFTHNDGVQIVGGPYCTFDRVRFSGTMRNAAFMINATKQRIDRLTITGCWFENDSPSGINISNAKPLHDLTITDNTFPKVWDGKKYPVLLSTVTEQDGTFVIADNKWDDGSRPGPAYKIGA